MENSLRAFLMIHTGTEWTTLVHTEFKSLLKTWNSLPNPSETTGVFHVGFIHPPARRFESFIEEYRGCLLVTAAAKFGLPDGYTASDFTVGFVEDLPVHLGIDGWGHKLSWERLEAEQRPAERRPISDPAIEWVRKFLIEEPNFTVLLSEHSIYDDRSYLEYERKLPFRARKSLGIFRFIELVNGEMSDPCKFARASPPWFLARTFETIALPIRIVNIFRKAEITTVADLAAITFEKLLGTTNFGSKSLTQLLEALHFALDQGPYGEQFKTSPSQNCSETNP